MEQEALPYTVFQPLYIYGPSTAKDCEQWFMDRILRWGTSGSDTALLKRVFVKEPVHHCRPGK